MPRLTLRHASHTHLVCYAAETREIIFGFNPIKQKHKVGNNIVIDEAEAAKLKNSVQSLSFTIKYIFIDSDLCSKDPMQKCIEFNRSWEQLTTPWGIFENDGEFKIVGRP